MSRSQFRMLVVINQLLVLLGMFVQRITDPSLPPELKNYLGIDQSVLAPQISTPLTDFSAWLPTVILVVGVVAALGLCFGKGWGRTLFLLATITNVVSALWWGLYVDTGWTVFVGSLIGITEGMILALIYFSHVKRMFEREL